MYDNDAGDVFGFVTAQRYV